MAYKKTSRSGVGIWLGAALLLAACPQNPDAADGYASLAQELWAQTGGSLDAFVQSVGTAQCITGVARGLRARHPRVQVIAVEPSESAVLSGGAPGPHPIQGIGGGFVPDILDRSLIDEIVTVGNDESFDTARRLARLEGIPGGISSGAAVAAALQVGKRPEMAGRTIVAIIPSFAERYITTVLFEGL